jgi:hypothetical protein
MTDTLRDLLRESVADADMPDVAELAWAEGGRARLRRAASAVAGVAAVALLATGVVWAVGQRDGHRAAQPVRPPSPTAPSTPYAEKDKPDGEYQGTSVWWAPSVEQESSLPAYPDGPLPRTIDLSAPALSLASDPLRSAVAAFALVGDSGSPSEVLLLGPDGSLHAVPLTADDGSPAPVSPMRDPEGNLRVRAGASMLSPSGKYLMFPQAGSIRLLRLRDSRWSTIATGFSAWDATWTAEDDIVLWDPDRPDAHAPVYGVDGRPVSRARAPDELNPRWNGDLYGVPRRSLTGSLAQSYIAGLDVPQPPELHLSPRQSDAIGIASAPDAMLVLPQEPARQKECCPVAGWLDTDVLLFESRSSEGLRLLAWQQGTGRFWQVSRVVGWTMGQESVVSSYATFWSMRAT